MSMDGWFRVRSVAVGVRGSGRVVHALADASRTPVRSDHGGAFLLGSSGLAVRAGRADRDRPALAAQAFGLGFGVLSRGRTAAPDRVTPGRQRHALRHERLPSHEEAPLRTTETVTPAGRRSTPGSAWWCRCRAA